MQCVSLKSICIFLDDSILSPQHATELWYNSITLMHRKVISITKCSLEIHVCTCDNSGTFSLVETKPV